MSYEFTASVVLGSGLPGLTDLRAQLVNTSGVNVGSELTGGFSEIGGGNYLWAHTLDETFAGGVKFYRAAFPATVLAFTDIDPQVALPSFPPPASNTSPIRATVSDLLSFYDERTIRELLTDSEVAITGDLTLNARLASMLRSSTGRLESACYVSGNYTPEELSNLADNAQALAAEIICSLVMVTLMRRRPERYPVETIKMMHDDSEAYIQQLRNGERLFEINANRTHEEAGKEKISWPTIEQINDRNAITRRTKHFYPDTTRDLPLRLGGG